MKAKDILKRIKEFKDLLNEHCELYEKSLGESLSWYPIRNKEQLKEQQIKLFKLFYPIDNYLSKFSKGRLMYLPAINLRFDVYKEAISSNSAHIKGPSLQNALLELEGIIAILEEKNPEEEITFNYISSHEKHIFVSHGRETNALIKVERLLRGLGLNPIIVKNEPSLGKAIDDLVEEKMSICLAVIILATKDDKIIDENGDEYYQPRPNVIHEIGVAQEKVKEKIIYLKEEGCDFPSNISPKVWETFTQENMENAILKIVKELKAFGIIQ